MSEQTGYKHLLEEQKSKAEAIMSHRVFKLSLIIAFGIFVLIIIFVLGLLIGLTARKKPSIKTPYTVDVAYKSDVQPTPKFVDSYWQGNSVAYWRYESVNSTDDVCNLVLHDPETNAITILFEQALYSDQVDCNALVSFSSEGKYILIEEKDSYESIYFHSSKEKYLLYNTETQSLADLLADPKEKLLHYNWCKSSLAYVVNNNLFVKNFETGEVSQITTDGEYGVVYNGFADFLYEMEVWESSRTFFWNADCSKISWLRLDDSQVEVLNLENKDDDSVYPTFTELRFPAVGSKNPIPSVHVYDIASNRISNISLGPVNTGDILKDFYVTDIRWASVNKLAVVTVPRIQQQKTLWLANLQDSAIPVVQPLKVREESSATWIIAPRAIRFISESEYVDLVPVNNTLHIALFSVDNPDPVKYLTSGKYQVVEIFDEVNQKTSEIFYISTERHSTERHVFAVNFQTGAKRALTNVKKEAYYSAHFRPDGQYFVQNYEGPNVPYFAIRSTSPSNTTEIVIEENVALHEFLKEFAMPHFKLTTIKNDEGHSLNTLLLFPPDWKSGTQHQYPVVIVQNLFYQSANKRFTTMYDPFYLVLANSGFIVAAVDTRGSPFQGISFLTAPFKRFGSVEVEDILAVAKKLGARSDTDAGRISVLGYSIGGFAATKVLTSPLNTKIIRSAVAISPLSDLRRYNSAFTERYMLLPEMNEDGYSNSSVIAQLDNEECPLLPTVTENSDETQSVKQSGLKLIITHGSGDYNSPIFHTWALTRELQKRQIEFSSMIFPGLDGDFGSAETQYTMYNFVLNNLKH